LSFWDGSVPYHTQFAGNFPGATVPFGILTWAWLCNYVRATIMEGCLVRS
jgi:hypothetical protein